MMDLACHFVFRVGEIWMGNDLGENGNPQEFHYKLITCYSSQRHFLSQPDDDRSTNKKISVKKFGKRGKSLWDMAQSALQTPLR